MNAGGWIIMVASVGAVVLLFAWCLMKVLSTPGSSDHLHSQADIETPDAEDE